MPFGTNVPQGTTTEGQVPCNGAFLSANPDGTDLQLFAWGLRSDFGYRFDADGTLIASQNSGKPPPAPGGLRRLGDHLAGRGR